MSATLAAVEHSECTRPSLESTPMCAFIPKYHLLTLARLMHLGVACAGRVLGRRRRMEDGRVHNRARADADAAALQIDVDRLQHGAAKVVSLQQMAEVQDGRLIRPR